MLLIRICLCMWSRASPGTVLTSTWLYIKYVPSSRTSNSPERECILNTFWWIEIILQFFNTPSDKSHKQTSVNTQSSVMAPVTHKWTHAHLTILLLQKISQWFKSNDIFYQLTCKQSSCLSYYYNIFIIITEII